MASFAEMSAAQTASIQECVNEQINSRMELAGRAVTFIADIDSQQKEVIGKIGEEIARMDQRVEEINLLKTVVEASYVEPAANLQQVSDGMKSFAAKTEANIASGTQADTVASGKAATATCR